VHNLEIKYRTRKVGQPIRKTATAFTGAVIASALAGFVKRPQSGSNRRWIQYADPSFKYQCAIGAASPSLVEMVLI
jgi:hypothetical protein